jgi:hypothetical protein
MRYQWFALRKNLWDNAAMKEDAIVTEVRTARESILKRFDYDVQAMLHDVQQRQRQPGRRVVSPVRPLARRKKSA